MRVRTLPVALSVPWRTSALTLMALATLPLTLEMVGRVIAGWVAFDWETLTAASQRVHEGGLYTPVAEEAYGYPYSPLLAILLGPIMALGLGAWRLLQVVAVMALPSWPLRVLAVVSWPFWFDVQHGGVMAFALLAAVYALRGNRYAQVAYIVVCLLIPRPLFLPLLVWLLWREPWTRGPFTALTTTALIGVLLTGWGPAWIDAMLASTRQVASEWNVGPSRLVGWAWLAVGIPLTAWLTWKGRPGLAGLALSPYILPYYLMFALLDLAEPDEVEERFTA